jgi:folate-binding protein YgfZ
MAATDTDRLHAEYEALVFGCGLLDRSERGKLALSGAGAVEFLNGQVTNELADLAPGEGRYAAFLTNKGKMLGDLRVLAVGGEPTSTGALDYTAAAQPAVAPTPRTACAPVRELLLDTERVALQALFDMICRYKIGYEVELHKRTLECALLSLIGPGAHEVATRALACEAALPEAEHAHIATAIADRPVRLIATADGGLDVLCASSDGEAVRAALLDADPSGARTHGPTDRTPQDRVGLRAVGEDAAEIVRVERGRPRYGVDLDERTIPQEAGLNERAVSFTKGCYVGQETVARLHYRGKPNRHLRGLRILDPAHPAAPGDELRLGGRPVGRLGSVALSPTYGTIGLALVRREAGPGDTVVVGAHDTTAAVVELPFR